MLGKRVKSLADREVVSNSERVSGYGVANSLGDMSKIPLPFVTPKRCLSTRAM